jgi:glycosyltransferase involved in cell wall biosynthesis
MNILHLRVSNFYGGPERQLHFHARFARTTEYHVTIGSFSEHGERPEFLDTIEADGLAVHLFPVTSAYDRQAVSLLKNYLKANRIDVLCTHEYRTHLIGMLSTRGTNTGWVAFSRGWTMDNLKVRLYHLLDKGIIRFADHIVAVSKAQKKRLERLLITGKQISVAYNSIMPEAFDPVAPVNLRDRYGFPPDSVVCISAGRFSREKGQRFFVAAAGDALKSNAKLRFVLFGDGPDYADLSASIAAAGLTDSIRCPGHEKNLIGCLKGADILVNPSLSEGLPNIVLEGMAVGVPVIATAVGGVPEMLTDRQNGLLVPAADSKALSAALQSLAADRDLQKQVTHAAARTIKETFSFQQQFADIAAVYDRWKVSR